MIEMIDINKNHFETILFNFLKNNNFTDIKYLTRRTFKMSYFLFILFQKNISNYIIYAFY